MVTRCAGSARPLRRRARWTLCLSRLSFSQVGEEHAIGLDVAKVDVETARVHAVQRGTVERRAASAGGIESRSRSPSSQRASVLLPAAKRQVDEEVGEGLVRLPGVALDRDEVVIEHLPRRDRDRQEPPEVVDLVQGVERGEVRQSEDLLLVEAFGGLDQHVVDATDGRPLPIERPTSERDAARAASSARASAKADSPNTRLALAFSRSAYRATPCGEAAATRVRRSVAAGGAWAAAAGGAGAGRAAPRWPT